ncbi:hypothetical protein RJZ56_001217 [Blastomyces dermatitidis]|uniref:Serine protease n=3 Tax=Blastomyces TaxID=229219 RepID=A0A179UIC0_BLAGS|nr:uncharacterized protein BDBG_03549 [Blastomyces gilchristii SLH14081]XP_045272827.1 uncharacterized protein BDCG_08236 [Blastomyces dermatitidis ER-3]EGE79258.1 hypothetical protein BDDG_02196 [Blastomyces dermatitidis ATCC 18188]EQL35733.1 hypothetical protein BDFG_02665 [Blastomyces dermatitidis ATCC 26199]EEQ84967.1 hypothetical protein BDCG_08236 [Blastomyces dermatitidis ER-3]OAT07493.1 hypothetical protein BDBG_03549 [Blastomyces gilchristii SLH14081]
MRLFHSVTRFVFHFIIITSVTAVPLFKDSRKLCGGPSSIPNLDSEELIQIDLDHVASSSFWNTGNHKPDSTLDADSGGTPGYSPIQAHLGEAFPPPIIPWTAENADRLSKANSNNTGLYYRDQVVNLTTYPWSTIGRVSFQRFKTDTGGWCTGSLVGRNLILTASHCFPWGYGRDRWMRFSPGYGNGSEPYGSSYISRCRGVKNTFNVTGIDYIVCQLCEALGDRAGWMGTRWWKDADFYMDRSWRSSGYPADAFQGDEQMLLADIRLLDVDFHGRLGKELEARTFASPGWSGGPMWEYIDGQPTIVGVCSGGEKDCSEEVGSCNGMEDSSSYHDVSAGGKLMTDLVAYGLAHWDSAGYME